MSLERNFTETFVARLAAREKQMQQHYRPVISVHKWFARRPGSLFRALAIAEFGDVPVHRSYAKAHKLEGVCLDPFMGGGTPVLEASRMGMAVIGYDTNPMSRWLVERELEAVDPDDLAATGERVARDVERRVGRLYRTTCPTCEGDALARYFIWVRHHRCGCGSETPLLADTTLVTPGLKRHSCEVHVCSCCLRLSEHPAKQRSVDCPHCSQGFDERLVPPDTLMSCACGETWRIPPRGSIETPSQELVGVDYHCQTCSEPARRTYKTADDRDHALVMRAECRSRTQGLTFLPDDAIPRRGETDRLLRWGFLRWIDLFGPRQRLGLGLLAERIGEEPDGPVKAALQTVFSDGLRYQNSLVRYDRQALKPTDVFAVHGFPVPRVSCEVALLGEAGVGSGGFRHILAKYVRAKRWCAEPYETVPCNGKLKLKRVKVDGERLAATMIDQPAALVGRTGLLRRASLGPGGVPGELVDIVLTDPPYFANVQYAELMDFCYVWLRRLAPVTPYFGVSHTKTAEDAVGSKRGVGLTEFAERLSEVFEAASAALRSGGAFCFTYHHNELDAYAPLVVACLNAGLAPTALFACPSEMRASTHIHGRNASTVDSVFVLRKAPHSGVSRENFGDLDLARHIRARLDALRHAGIKTTAADRSCVRHAALAVRAMAQLASSWEALPAVDRLPHAIVALGLQAPAPVAVPAA